MSEASPSPAADAARRVDRVARDLAFAKRAGLAAVAGVLALTIVLFVAAGRSGDAEAARALEAAEAASTEAGAALERAEAALSAAEAARTVASEAVVGVEEVRAALEQAVAGAEESRRAAVEALSGGEETRRAADEAAAAVEIMRGEIGAAVGRLDTLGGAAEEAESVLVALAEELATLRTEAEARDAEVQAALDQLSQVRRREAAELPASVASGSFLIGERRVEPQFLAGGQAYVIGYETFPEGFDAGAFSDAEPAVVLSVSAEVEEPGQLEVGDYSSQLLYAEPGGFAWFASAPDEASLSEARLTYMAVAQ